MYKVGEKVVYPHHGAGTIEAQFLPQSHTAPIWRPYLGVNTIMQDGDEVGWNTRDHHVSLCGMRDGNDPVETTHQPPIKLPIEVP